MTIATADLATQATETLAALLDTARPGRRRNRIIDLLAERGAIETPAAFTELAIDDIVTFGSRKTEWVVTERVGRVIRVRQIKGSQVGQTVALSDVDGDATRVWRVL